MSTLSRRPGGKVERISIQVRLGQEREGTLKVCLRPAPVVSGPGVCLRVPPGESGDVRGALGGQRGSRVDVCDVVTPVGVGSRSPSRRECRATSDPTGGGSVSPVRPNEVVTDTLFLVQLFIVGGKSFRGG